MKRISRIADRSVSFNRIHVRFLSRVRALRNNHSVKLLLCIRKHPFTLRCLYLEQYCAVIVVVIRNKGCSLCSVRIPYRQFFIKPVLAFRCRRCCLLRILVLNLCSRTLPVRDINHTLNLFLLHGRDCLSAVKCHVHCSVTVVGNTFFVDCHLRFCCLSLFIRQRIRVSRIKRHLAVYCVRLRLCERLYYIRFSLTFLQCGVYLFIYIHDCHGGNHLQLSRVGISYHDTLT